MAVRGRPTSSTPEQTVERFAALAHVPIPGSEESRKNRVAGLGPLLGLATGVGVGVLLAFGQAAGLRPGPVAVAGSATALALLGANAPMTALGITDPRTWPVSAWVADVVPHLAYGATG